MIVHGILSKRCYSFFMNVTFDREPLLSFRKRLLKQTPSALNAGWEDTLVPQGMMIAGKAFQDEAFISFSKKWADHHLAAGIQNQPHAFHEKRPDGFFLNDYCGDWALALVFGPLYSETKDARYLPPILQFGEHILQHAVRLQDGIMAHGGWDYARKTVWVDTLYYAGSVLAETYRSTGEIRYAQEAIRQCLLHAQLLQDPGTGCYFHDTEPESGRRTPWFWSRGNGWIIMSLADTLRLCPSHLPGWNEVLKSYRSLVAGLLKYQHASGIWRIVPEKEESHLETSGSAMILVGLTVGLGHGWIESTLRSQILKGYEELLTWIRPRDGALMGAQSPAGLGGWETHKHSIMTECTYATGMFIRLVGEMKASGKFE